MWLNDIDFSLAIGVAIAAPSLAGLLGVSRRLLVAAGGFGAVLVWLVLTVDSPSDDYDLTKTG